MLKIGDPQPSVQDATQDVVPQREMSETNAINMAPTYAARRKPLMAPCAAASTTLTVSRSMAAEFPRAGFRGCLRSRARMIFGDQHACRSRQQACGNEVTRESFRRRAFLHTQAAPSPPRWTFQAS